MFCNLEKPIKGNAYQYIFINGQRNKNQNNGNV